MVTQSAWRHCNARDPEPYQLASLSCIETMARHRGGGGAYHARGMARTPRGMARTQGSGLKRRKSQGRREVDADVRAVLAHCGRFGRRTRNSLALFEDDIVDAIPCGEITRTF